MQRYTIIFIAVSALHVPGGFSAHHQELKLYIQHMSSLLAATASVGELKTEKSKIIWLSMFSDIRKNIAFMTRRLRPVILLIRATCR